MMVHRFRGKLMKLYGYQYSLTAELLSWSSQQLKSLNTPPCGQNTKYHENTWEEFWPIEISSYLCFEQFWYTVECFHTSRYKGMYADAKRFLNMCSYNQPDLLLKKNPSFIS